MCPSLVGSEAWRSSITSGFALPNDAGEGVVGVNALLVYGLDLEGRDAGVVFQEKRDVAYEVFDENRIVMSLHGHVALVGALEQSVDRRGGRFLGNLDEFFDPDPSPALLR